MVVVRSWQPPGENTTPEGEAAAASSGELVDGIVAGLQDGGVPVIGVQRTGADPSTVGYFRDRGVSTVDDVDAVPGQVALAVLLAGGQPGAYGIGDDVAGISPPIDPVPASTVAE